MVSTEQFKKAVGLINNAKNVLLTTHTRPDGDACGSIAAMCEILTSMGKKVNPILSRRCRCGMNFCLLKRASAGNTRQ